MTDTDEAFLERGRVSEAISFVRVCNKSSVVEVNRVTSVVEAYSADYFR